MAAKKLMMESNNNEDIINYSIKYNVLSKLTSFIAYEKIIDNITSDIE